MKLQTAIDRVNLSQAEELVKLFAGKTDIIELGTSLVKDYGLFALKKLNQYKKDSLLLVDIKTCGLILHAAFASKVAAFAALFSLGLPHMISESNSLSYFLKNTSFTFS